jgi:cell wall-associated NlpC family hydrolase
VDEARKLAAKHVRFRHQGRDLNGLDCWGVVVYVCRQLGIPVADELSYDINPPPALARKLLGLTAGQARPGWDARLADLLLLEVGGQPVHVGIFARHHERAYLISSSLRSRRVAEHALDERFPYRVVACYSIPGLT